MVDLGVILGSSFSGAVIAALIFVIVHLLTNPEKVDKWRAFFNKIFASCSTKREKNYVASDIQYNINSAIDTMNKETAIDKSDEDILPYGLRIIWTKDTTREAFVRGEEMVVRMKYHTHQDENLTVATMIYLSKGLLPYARQYVDSDVMKSVDLTIGKKIIKENPVSLDYFFDEILKQEEKRVINLCGFMDEIDKAGLFTRILLREFRNLGRKMYPQQIRNQNIPKETKRFVKFVWEIATKERDEDVPLIFSESKINVGICLVAKPWRRRIGPYCKRVRRYLNNDKIDEIYIFAIGKEHVDLAKDVKKQFSKNPAIIHTKEKEYTLKDYRNTGKILPGICIILKKGKIPDSIRVLLNLLNENKEKWFFGANLAQIIRKKKGFENWPKSDYRNVHQCIKTAEDMEFVEVEKSGQDLKVKIISNLEEDEIK